MVRDAREKECIPNHRGESRVSRWDGRKDHGEQEKACKEHSTPLSMWTASNGVTLKKKVVSSICFNLRSLSHLV